MFFASARAPSVATAVKRGLYGAKRVRAMLVGGRRSVVAEAARVF